MTTMKVIGVMSGTSLDGLDLACCEFFLDDKNQYGYKLLCAETISYSEKWKLRLADAFNSKAVDVFELNSTFGIYMAECIQHFIKKNNLEVDLISSHGHTVFHQPKKKFTTQIGSGAIVNALCKIPVVCDFRSSDVALNGQGAPLVPIGDHLLFHNYSYCLNLGGIANVSFVLDDTRVAFDICPANQLLNAVAEQIKLPYDENGNIARKGKLNETLFQKLNDFDFYKKKFPKSLGREETEDFFLPLMKKNKLSPEDLLHTLCKHIAFQINQSLKDNTGSQNILVTGGGAHNGFLLECIQEMCKAKVVIPDADTINFKEAIVFGFLGWLRWHGKENVLSSVTGADRNSTSGCIYSA